MNIFITLAILLANLVAIALVYQFIKKLPQMEKIIFIVISFAIVYVGVTISYWISGFGIDSQINEAAKSFVTYIFVPVNVIILIPFVAVKYNKWKQNEIDSLKLIKRVVIVAIVGIIILSIESVYFKQIKKNISEMISTTQLKTEVQEDIEYKNQLDENSITNSTNEISVEITNMEVTNKEIKNNVISNSINVNN